MKRLMWSALTLVLVQHSIPGQEFRRLHGQSPSNVGLSELTTIDLDVDGDLDLVGVDASGLVALENDGWGRFTRRVLVAGSLVASDLSVRDYAADALPDVLLQGTSSLRLFVNQGGLAFLELSANLPPSTGYREHDAGDVDGDGDADLILTGGSFTGLNDGLYLNRGNGVFDDASANLPALKSGRARFFDAELDGDLDYLAAGSKTYLVRNDGRGVFAVDSTASIPRLSSRELRIQDIDLDGYADLLMWDAWALNDGTGSFPTRNSTGYQYVRDYLFLDWDGFGAQDLIMLPPINYVTEMSIGLWAFRGTTRGKVTRVPSAALEGIPSEVQRIAAGDWDGDGDVDLFAETDRDLVIFNRGEGAMEIATTSPEGPQREYWGIGLVDADGDGDLDGLVGETDNYGDVYLASLENDGAGRFGEPMRITGHRLEGFATFDLENDGDQDIVSVHGFGPPSSLHVWVNDGTGHWDDLKTLPVPPGLDAPYTSDPLTGDLNGDGFDDLLIIADKGPQNIPTYLLLNDGNGGFTRTASGISKYSHHGELGDLDNDGDLDVVTFEGNRVRVYLNDGAAGFIWTGAQIRAPFVYTDLKLGHIDEDGRLDLVFLHSGPSALLQVFAGDGTGGFSPTPALTETRPGGGALTHLELFDADGDGREDVFSTDGGLWFNQPGFDLQASFASLPRPGKGSQNALPAAGDLDLDGDVDLWSGGENQVLWNVTRQVAWRNWPRVGKPLTLDLYGAGGAFYGLWLGTRLGNLQTPWGLFRLDPSTALRLSVGYLDGNGERAITVPIPNEPSLSGITAYLQGIIGTPLRFSNLESVVLGGS